MNARTDLEVADWLASLPRQRYSLKGTILPDYARDVIRTRAGIEPCGAWKRRLVAHQLGRALGWYGDVQ